MVYTKGLNFHLNKRLHLTCRKLDPIVPGMESSLGNYKGRVTLHCKHSDTYNVETYNLPDMSLQQLELFTNFQTGRLDFNVKVLINIMLVTDVHKFPVAQQMKRRT